MVEPLATIGSAGDSVDLNAYPRPVLSADGRFILATRIELPASLVAMQDSAGRYLGTVGRAGRGPGEISDLTSFGFGPGDSLWVVDGLMQAHLYAPAPAATYVRTVRFDRLSPAAVDPQGFVVRSIVIGDRSGTTLQEPRLVGFDGKVQATYGPSLVGQNSNAHMGVVDVVDGTSAWVARSGEYALELLGADGTMRRRITREVDWFPFDTTVWDRRSKPRSRIRDIALDDEGRLWVLLARARGDWESRLSEVPRIAGPVSARAMRGVRPVDQLYDGVLEVLDAETGNVLATRDVAGNVLGFAAPGVIYEQGEDPAGLVTMRLSRVSLSRPLRP
jgi:hypothetical protein